MAGEMVPGTQPITDLDEDAPRYERWRTYTPGPGDVPLVEGFGATRQESEDAHRIASAWGRLPMGTDIYDKDVFHNGKVVGTLVRGPGGVGGIGIRPPRPQLARIADDHPAYRARPAPAPFVATQHGAVVATADEPPPEPPKLNLWQRLAKLFR